MLSQISCKRSAKNVDPFYTNRGEWDDVELPLIKPYQLIKLNGMSWSMNTEDANMLDSVKQVNVVNGTICVNSMKTYFEHRDLAREVWSVFIPSEKIEKHFLYFSQYEEYLKVRGWQAAPQLYNVDDVAIYAGNNEVINWRKIK